MAIESIQKIIRIDTDGAVKSLTNLENVTKETGQSFQSMKDYKTYIDKLRASLYDLDETSQDYIDTEKKLRQETEKYNRILKTAGSEATVAEGSYNALAKKMAELKKIWKETGDATKRTEIGTQINEINNQLKEMDATVGNYQRNVGNYAEGFTQGFKKITDAIGIQIPAVRSFGDAIDKIYVAWSSFKAISASLKEAGGLTAIFKGSAKGADVNTKELERLTRTTKNWQIAEAGAEAAGIGYNRMLARQTQNVVKNQVANQEAIAEIAKLEKKRFDILRTHTDDLFTEDLSKVSSDIAKNIQKARDEYNELGNKIAEKQKAINNSVAQGITLAERWNKLFIGTRIGLGIVAAAAAALIGVIVHIVKKAKEAREEFIKWRTELNSLEKDAGLEILVLQDLATSYRALNGDIEKQNQFLEDNAKEIEKTTLNINDLNTADEIFIKNTDKYIQALKDRAKAQAAEQLAVSKYAEMIEKVAELRAEQKLAPKGNIEGGNTAESAMYPSVNYVYRKTQSEYQKEIDKTISDYEDNIDKLFEIRNKAKAASDAVLAAFTGEKPKDDTDKNELNIKIETEKKQKELEAILLQRKKMMDDFYKLLQREQDKIKITDVILDTDTLDEDIEFVGREVFDTLQGIMDNRIAIEEEGNDRLIKDGGYFNERYLELLKQREEMNFNEAKARLELEGATNEEIETLEELHQKRMIAIDRKAAIQRAYIVTDMVGQVAQATSDLMSAVADSYEEGTEENKKMQIAATTLNMFAGVSMAISQAMQAGPILGPILGAINAATVIATGIAQIKKIQQTTLDSASSQSTSAVAAASYKPDYSKNVTGESEVSSLRNAISGGIESSVNDIKVYVLEEDITKAQKKVNVRQTEATF